MKAFPFPDHIGSREELKRDLLYHKIPPKDINEISNMAWDTGVNAAKNLISEYGTEISMEEIAKANGLIVERKNKDNIAGNVRYFSEYYSGQNKIILYTDSIKKWADSNNMVYIEAEELILSHEFYHFLECTKLGLTSKKYTVPTIKIGSLNIGKSGIRALSEIGAHGFSRTIYELKGILITSDISKNNTVLQNHAINTVAFSNKLMTDKIFNKGPFKIFIPKNREVKK